MGKSEQARVSYRWPRACGLLKGLGGGCGLEVGMEDDAQVEQDGVECAFRLKSFRADYYKSITFQTQTTQSK